MKTVIIMGSLSDESHAKKITNKLDEYKILWEKHVASAHKQPLQVLKILDENEYPDKKNIDDIFIEYSNRYNELNKFWNLRNFFGGVIEHLIILDEGRKSTYSKLFLKYKLDTKTVIEAEHKARTDPEYSEVVKHYAEAEEQLIKAKFHYQNLDRYLSVRQTEIKRDLALVGKQEG